MNRKSMMMCAALLGCTAMMGATAARAATDQDKTFLSTASQSDFNEIRLSQLAESKASSPEVKKFAEKMVTDHTALEAKMKPFADMWGLTPASSLDAEHQAVYDKLNGLSGSDFDKQYMMAMQMDHQKALDAFKMEESSTTDAKFKKAVAEGEKKVADHKMMADKLGSKIGTSMSGM
jgi:putative membrane protein